MMGLLRTNDLQLTQNGEFVLGYRVLSKTVEVNGYRLKIK